MAKKKRSRKQLEYQGGIIVSHGIAMGKALVLVADLSYIPKYAILKSQVDHELARLQNSILKTQQEIRQIKAQVDTDELVRGNLNYMDAHLLMLNDPLLHSQIQKEIQEKLMNVETVFCSAIAGLIEKMGSIDNAYLRDRVEDLRDIQKMVLLNLLGKEPQDLRKLDEDVVIIAHNLTPSQTATMDREHVKGLITEIGGKTSHSAILARALEIPAIVGVHDLTREIEGGDFVILDASHGKVIVNPLLRTVKEYRTAKHVFDRFLKKLAFLNTLPAETLDQELVHLYANIEIAAEIDSVKAHGADGIGLFRSEFLFIDKKEFPSEQEQYDIYCSVLERMDGQPVVIRTMDLGGDKLSYAHRNYQEANPFLGWRSIRFCLTMTDIFRTQLRALLRASTKGDLRIMLPMISGLDELNQALEIINQVKQELRREKQAFREDMPVGIMIEVPSAVMVADDLAKQVSFFSIGTNDLIQYTIAVDRGNERISYLYKALHPAVLRLIRMTIEAGERNGIPVEMCGEMAGNPLYTVLLLGMGLKRMSMSSSSIPEVKKIIRSIKYEEAKLMAQQAQTIESTHAVEEFVYGFMQDHFPEMMDKIIS